MKTMSSSQTDFLIGRIFDHAFNRGNFSALEESLALSSIIHVSAWGIPNNRLGLKQLIASLRLAFPDLRCTVEDKIEQGDKFAALWTMRGTHTGLFFGNQPTGRPVEVQGSILAYTEAGRIVEEWILIDQMAILQQLGLVPPQRGKI
jgi:predicted ester cyclase